MARTYDHIVIGAGIMGAATAAELGTRGRRVCLLERYRLGHVQGSSHGSSRIFRLAYDSPVYVEMAQRSRERWLRLEEATQVELMRPGGVIDLGPAEILQPIHEALDDRHARNDFGLTVPGSDQFDLPEGFLSLYQPDGGATWAGRAHEAFLAVARNAGVEILEETPALAIHPRSSAVGVSVPGNELEAESIVVTAAGWSERSLQPLGIQVPLRVTREHVAYYRRRRDAPFIPFIWHPTDGAPETYGLPHLENETVKIGRHIAGEVVDPDSPAEVIPIEVDLISNFVASHLPVLDPEPVSAETCLYASTPDDDFVLDRAGAIVVGAGFGGHGFKFAPLIGEILADLATGLSRDVDQRFSLDRFVVARA